jgi:sialate O-acetylesterase
MLPPLLAGSYSLNMTSPSTGTFATLTDVLAGETFLCSGQSNMEFTVPGSFNATAECSAAAFADLAGLRIMRVGRSQSSSPEPELLPAAFGGSALNWSAASPQNVCPSSHSRGLGFSAACFFFARELHRQLRVPVGAVDSSWGGTKIENWMSAEAMGSCPHAPCGNCTSEVAQPSVLYNAMLHPFRRLRFASLVWWQGTSNGWEVQNAREYGCNQRSFIADLRAKFGAEELPFLFVQNFPQIADLSTFQPYPGHPRGASVLYGLPELRLAQAESLRLPRVGMACAIDLGDASSPFTWQHNRAKQVAARRLLRAADALLYNQSVVWRGPEPRAVARLAPHELAADHPYTELAVTFDMFGSEGFERADVPLSMLSFEALARGPLAPGCEPEADASDVAEFWIPMSLLPMERTDATNSIGLGVTTWFSSNATIVALRFGYSDFPTGGLHTREGLPLPPFRINCSLVVHVR